MNLVKIGRETFNLALVQRYKEIAPVDEHAPLRLELVFCNGATAALEGEEALAMIRFLHSNSANLALDPGPGTFASGEGTLPLKAEGGKEGA